MDHQGKDEDEKSYLRVEKIQAFLVSVISEHFPQPEAHEFFA
jgi:hypothetical protein